MSPDLRSEYVRRLVASDLGTRKRRADVSALFDLGASDQTTDVGRDKDKMIGEAVSRDRTKAIGRARKSASKRRKA